MDVMIAIVKKWKCKVVLAAFLCAVGLAAGCASTPQPVAKKELPPVLSREEVLRPYQKVAVVEVHRTRYGSPSDLTPQDYAWVYDALRQEASRLGADAVIFPEVKVEVEQNYIMFPSSEMRGKGVAIKFQ